MESNSTDLRVRGLLKNISDSNKINFDELRTYYVYERILYRLGESKYKDSFILKGGMLVKSWFQNQLRITKDLDFLGYGEPNHSIVLSYFQELLAMKYEDGIQFDPKNIDVSAIREGNKYDGIRLKTIARVAKMETYVKVDIGYGDVVVPPDEFIEYPTILEFPTPKLRSYTKETVIAEKFHAISRYEEWSSRMKDYFDIWKISELNVIDSNELARSIFATFSHRDSTIPIEPPPALSNDLLSNPLALETWDLFVKRRTIYKTLDFSIVLDEVKKFLMRHAKLANEIALESN